MSHTKITVDVTQTDPAHRIKPLCGVNGGPIEAGKYDNPPHGGYPLNYTILYREAGIQSVRTHETVLDIANIFRGQTGTWPVGVQEFEKGVAASREYLHLAYTQAGMTPDDFQAAAAAAMAGSFIFGLKGMPGFFADARLGDCWLYWKPTNMAAALDVNNYEWDDNHAWDTYRAITSAGMEVYFRLGEGYHGPAYMGADEVENHTGMALYAEAAGEVVAYLASRPSGSDPPVMPGFIEIVNEPDSSGFMGPLDQPSAGRDLTTGLYNRYDKSDRAKLRRWCWEFQELFAHCVSALTSRGIPASCIGSPGFTDHGARELVRYMGGGDASMRENDSKVYRLLHRLLDQDPSSVNFAAFHWYGAFEDRDEDDPRTVAARFPSEIRDTADALKAVMSEFGVDRPIHVNEWNLTPLQLPPGFDDSEYVMTTPLGGAFISLGLSVMQHPDLDIERAHFYSATSANSGLFHYEDDTFFIRPSAFAMKLHSGLLDDLWVPAAFQHQTRSPLGGSTWSAPSADIIAAVEGGCPVVALASRESGVHSQPRTSVVLTNLTEQERKVTLEINGLAPGTRSVRVKTIDASVLSSSVLIDESQMPWFSYIPPDADQAASAFLTFGDIENNPDENISGIPDTVYIDASGTCQFVLQVGSHGVMRIDLLESYAEQSVGEWPEGLPESEVAGDEGSGASGSDSGPFSEPPAKSEFSGRSLGDLPGGKAENLRCYRNCLLRMRQQMEERGYSVDDEMELRFWDYFAARTEELGRCPAELDVFDWYAWYRAHQG